MSNLSLPTAAILVTLVILAGFLIGLVVVYWRHAICAIYNGLIKQCRRRLTSVGRNARDERGERIEDLDLERQDPRKLAVAGGREN